MLQIRKEQIEVFDEVAVKSFEDQILKHLREYFPKHCEPLAEEEIRRIIRYGAERARGHGFTYIRSINLYLNLMFLLGSHFDTDLQLPWAAELIADRSIAHETPRIDRLYERASAYLDAVAGKKNEHINAALERARKEQLSTAPPPIDSPDFYRFVIARLQALYPHKCEAVGELNLRLLIRQGIETAGDYAITDARGVIIYIGLMFLLGTGFDTDPLFSWAGAILNKDAPGEQKAQQLYEASMTLLNHWLA